LHGNERVVDVRALLPVIAFTALYLLGAVALALARGNTEFLYYIAVMLVLVVVVWQVHSRVLLTTGTVWALSIWGLMHMAGGLLVVPASWPIDSGSRVLYSLWLIPDYLKYDQLVHAFGFGVATWVCWQGIRAAVAERGRVLQPSPGLMTLVALAGMGLGALNELVEFVATLLIPETNVGGYLNTGWDLVANFVGATFAASVIFIRGRKRRA